MFSEATFAGENFESAADTVKEVRDSGCQTVEIAVTTTLSQTAFRSTSEVQTEGIGSSAEAPAYDERKLAEFLQRISPPVIAELDKAAKSKAFTNYQLGRNESQDEVNQLYRLQSNHMPDLPNIQVSCLSWSCTGNVVAIGFASPGHEGWCVHQSAVHFYNISKHKLDVSKPDRVIDVNSCVSALAMHPYEPSVVALGTQFGEVQIWSTDKDEYEGSFQNSLHHKNRVTQIAWITLGSQLHLITSSLDGYLFSFKVIPTLRAVTLVERYLPNSLDSVFAPGITTFAFSRLPGIFVAALEGGELLHCSTYPACDARPRSATTIRQPVLKSLGKELGEVTCIEFSPYIDHLFITIHVEDKITIRSLNKGDPVREIYTDFTMVGAHWSPAQGNVVIGWGGSSHLGVYHFKSAQRMAHICPEGERPSSPHIICTAFNHKSPCLIAIGGENACVFVWEIPQYFQTPVDLI
ncbi:WD domain, G-beta repeat [Nesidiocoris tenuis]|uniref:WD domain, G-beta repeat n=1 Tax=Nesidiocoris tenuis TaxID=355587 RepID=A0ABN7BAL9_9HEMI|nr:WD domain, G-beta repeat [Nesidiocoris tenuis]